MWLLPLSPSILQLVHVVTISTTLDHTNETGNTKPKPGVHYHCEGSRPLGHLQSSAADWQDRVPCTCLHTQRYLARKRLEHLHQNWLGQALCRPVLESGARARQTQPTRTTIWAAVPIMLVTSWQMELGHWGTQGGHSQQRQHPLALGMSPRG